MRVLTRITLFILGLGLALIVPTGVALAAPVEQVRQETVQGVFNFCNGEQLSLDGIFTAVVKDNGDGTSTVIATVHASGTSTSSGTEYVFNQTRKSIVVGGSLEVKGDAVGVLVSKGSATNYVATFHFDFTVDPPVFDFEVNCVG